MRNTDIGQPPRPVRAMHRRHVNLVEVGPFLAIDFDVDEVRVHRGGDFGVLEAFMLHHVAPVAGAVANGEKDRPVELAGLLQRLLAPGMPIDGIIGVLQ